MSDILAYLQHYWKDVRSPAKVRHEWGSRGDRLRAQVPEKGDIIWVVITGGPDAPNEWRLLQKIVVDYHFKDPTDSYQFRVAAQEDQCAIYIPEEQPNLELLLQSLSFSSGRRITATGRRIGQMLQTARPLSAADSERLRQYADSLVPYG
jgi:hypothetical protein